MLEISFLVSFFFVHGVLFLKYKCNQHWYQPVHSICNYQAHSLGLSNQVLMIKAANA